VGLGTPGRLCARRGRRHNRRAGARGTGGDGGAPRRRPPLHEGRRPLEAEPVRTGREDAHTVPAGLPADHVLVLGETKDARGSRWLRVSLPTRPTGRTGWVPARSLETWVVHRRVLVDLSSRTLRVVERGRTRLTTKVAIGKPGAETPVGRFHVTAAFRPREPFYGSWALETSAYSRHSDWPGGGVVGIHGTSMPSLLGRAVSHGCVRVSNAAAQALRRLVRPGTPVQVKR
jgi:hypothetical protein